MSRYVPYCRLGVGDVADVYLGVLRGAEGFRRPVILERALSASAGAEAHERERVDGPDGIHQPDPGLLGVEPNRLLEVSREHTARASSPASKVGSAGS